MHSMLFKQKNHKDVMTNVLPGQQIPVTTDPGQILHIDSNTATLLNNFAINHYIRTIVQVNISYKLLFNQLNQFPIKLVSM